MFKRRVFSGAEWEKKVGYCRAVAVGRFVFVGGTAPVAPGGGTHAPGDAYAQAIRCFDIIEAALREQRSASAHSMDADARREATVETNPRPEVAPAPAPPPRAPRRRRVLAVAGGLAAAMTLLAAGLVAPWSRPPADTRAVDARPDLSANRRPTVVIAPFMSATEESTSVWLGDALPGLIAAKLAHFEQVEIVPVNSGAKRIVVRAIDRGPGIPNLEEVFSGRYRSKTGLGKGLLGTKRLADKFDISSSITGTQVTAEVAV